jgi:hypothetical protein
MANGTEQRRTGPERVAWESLERAGSQRISGPTNAIIRRLIGRVTTLRSRKPSADTIIMVALELAEGLKDTDLIAMVMRVEASTHEVPPVRRGDPGEPDSPTPE